MYIVSVYYQRQYEASCLNYVVYFYVGAFLRKARYSLMGNIYKVNTGELPKVLSNSIIEVSMYLIAFFQSR